LKTKGYALPSTTAQAFYHIDLAPADTASFDFHKDWNQIWQLETNALLLSVFEAMKGRRGNLFGLNEGYFSRVKFDRLLAVTDQGMFQPRSETGVSAAQAKIE
jgi:hypothetical protein